jgi:antitoxin (DNA-binding transcriptional repressor) of toxin-antitoxin stability system
MNTMTVRDFRTNLSANFDRVDAGERILVRRRNKVYTIIPVEDDDLTITPELQAKIDKARQDYKDGKTTTIRTHDELDAFFDSL